MNNAAPNFFEPHELPVLEGGVLESVKSREEAEQIRTMLKEIESQMPTAPRDELGNVDSEKLDLTPPEFIQLDESEAA